jgi:hypothetical protein
MKLIRLPIAAQISAYSFSIPPALSVRDAAACLSPACIRIVRIAGQTSITIDDKTMKLPTATICHDVALLLAQRTETYQIASPRYKRSADAR